MTDDGTTGHVPTDDAGEERERSDIAGLDSSSSRAVRGSGTDASDSTEDDSEEPPTIEGSLEDDRQIATIVQAVLAAKSETYSGLIPHPEHWDKFDPATQERILRMSEAYTTDESKRRDRIVDANISEAPKGRRNALFIILASVGCAAISAWTFENTIAAGIFLAIPIANVVKDFIQGRSSSSSKREIES